MLRSQLSILGMYQWNEDVFEGFRVPEEMDRETCITEILAQCSELELVYPSYDVMKGLITTWTKAELPIWERAYRDCTIEYNPIWNVDGTETETISRELTGANEGSKQGSSSLSSSGSSENESESIDSTKGYNSNSWTEADKTNYEGSGSHNESSQGNESEVTSGSNTESETITTEKIRGGNIGVTMTQQMLNADLDILPRLNPYQFIVDSFRRRFCLLVY